MDFIESTVKKEAINCAFERLDGFLFLDNTDTNISLEKELKAVQKAGLSNVTMIEESPLKLADNLRVYVFLTKPNFNHYST